MSAEIKIASTRLARRGLSELPAVIANAGPEATESFLEFFTASIRNRNTRAAYGRALCRFLAWVDSHGLGLRDIKPTHVAAFIEGHPGAPASVKLRASTLFDGRVSTFSEGLAAGSWGALI